MAVCNLAEGSTASKAAIAAAGAIPLLAALLESGTAEVQEVAARAVACLAPDDSSDAV